MTRPSHPVPLLEHRKPNGITAALSLSGGTGYSNLTLTPASQRSQCGLCFFVLLEAVPLGRIALQKAVQLRQHFPQLCSFYFYSRCAAGRPRGIRRGWRRAIDDHVFYSFPEQSNPTSLGAGPRCCGYESPTRRRSAPALFARRSWRCACVRGRATSN